MHPKRPCKDGYCSYRKGDITPGRTENRGILVDVVTEVAEVPCIGGCFSQTPAQRAAQLDKARWYRHFEKSLPPRQYVVV